MERNPDRKCETCVFYRTRGDGELGRCLRYPPDQNAAFPPVSKKSWCGEHRTQQEDDQHARATK